MKDSVYLSDGIFFMLKNIKNNQQKFCFIKNKYYICRCRFHAGAVCLEQGGIGRHIKNGVYYNALIAYNWFFHRFLVTCKEIKEENYGSYKIE